MILRAGLFAPLVPRALRLEAARQVGRTSDVALLVEMALRFPEGVAYALKLWPEEHRAELFLHPELRSFLQPFLERDSWRLAMAYAGLEPPLAREMAAAYPPRDPAARALLYVLAEMWDEYLDLDVSQTLLREALELCQQEVRVRVLRMLPASGRPELVRAVVLSGREWLDIPSEEWLPRLELLARHGSLFEVLPRLRPEQALYGVEQLVASGWRPPPALSAAWERLLSAGLPGWQFLEAQMRGPRVTLRVPAREGLVLSPCGRKMAWRDWLGRLDQDYGELCRLPRYRRMEFSPSGDLLAGVDRGVQLLVVDIPRIGLACEAPHDSEFRLSPTRHLTRGVGTITLWPGGDSTRVDGLDQFEALDPPGAIVTDHSGRMGVFWSGGKELRWQEKQHPGRVDGLAVRPGRRRYVATCGAEGTVLWRLRELVSPYLDVVSPILPPASRVAFFKDFLVADGRVYSLENALLVRELPGTVVFLRDLGEVLAIGLADGTLRFWDGSEDQLIAGFGPIEQCVRVPAGYWAVAGGELIKLEDPVSERTLVDCAPEFPAVEALQLFMRAFDVEVAEVTDPGGGETDIELD